MMELFPNLIPDPELGYHPCGDLQQEKFSQLPLSCEKLKSVSYRSTSLARTCHFPKMQKIPPDVDFESSRHRYILFCARNHLEGNG